LHVLVAITILPALFCISQLPKFTQQQLTLTTEICIDQKAEGMRPLDSESNEFCTKIVRDIVTKTEEVQRDAGWMTRLSVCSDWIRSSRDSITTIHQVRKTGQVNGNIGRWRSICVRGVRSQSSSCKLVNITGISYAGNIKELGMRRIFDVDTVSIALLWKQ
jgi:hypothetical protein